MKKQNPIILSITNPCHENWAEMTVVDKGRFCSHCQKAVTDLTGMSDTAIVQFFQQQTDRQCIRAFSSQLDRPIKLPPQAPTRFYRIAVALGLVLFSSAAANTSGHSRPPLSEQKPLGDDTGFTEWSSSPGDSLLVEGVVVDHHNKPVSRAMLRLMDGSRKQVFTDADGFFSMRIVKEKDEKSLYLYAFASGYQSNDTNILYSELKKSHKITIQLNREPEEEIIMGRGLGNVFYKRPFDADTEEKDSLGHIPAYIAPPEPAQK